MRVKIPFTLGLLKLVAFSIVIFALMELAGWPLAILAGVIVGLLASRWRDAVLAGALGALIGWLLYLTVYGLVAGAAMARALTLLPDFAAITLLLGLVLGSLSSSASYFALNLWRQIREQKAQARENKSS